MPKHRRAIGIGRKCSLTRSRGSGYRSLQVMYQRDVARAARWVLDDKENSICPIRPSLVEKAYQAIWGQTRDYTGLGQFADLPAADMAPFRCLVAPEEVLSVLQRMKRGTAPGPDGVRREDLLRWDPKGEKMSALFNTFLVNGKIPGCLKGSKTTLTPKSDDPSKLQDLNNWRPITIGPVLLRTFSGVMTRRLTESCRVHGQQRGFIESPGCSENLSELDGLLKLSKWNRKPLHVAFIDFRKAFDMVTHDHINEVLTRRGVDEHVRGLVRNSSSNRRRSYRQDLAPQGSQARGSHVPLAL